MRLSLCSCLALRATTRPVRGSAGHNCRLRSQRYATMLTSDAVTPSADTRRQLEARSAAAVSRPSLAPAASPDCVQGSSLLSTRDGGPSAGISGQGARHSAGCAGRRSRGGQVLVDQVHEGVRLAQAEADGRALHARLRQRVGDGVAEHRVQLQVLRQQQLCGRQQSRHGEQQTLDRHGQQPCLSGDTACSQGRLHPPLTPE